MGVQLLLTVLVSLRPDLQSVRLTGPASTTGHLQGLGASCLAATKHTSRNQPTGVFSSRV